MNIVLQIFLIVCLLFFLALVLGFVAKKKLNLKYSLTWLFAGVVMLLVTIFPQTAQALGELVGIATPVNAIFLFSGMFMMLILMTLTFIVSHVNNRIYRIAQSIALLEKKVRDFETCTENRIEDRNDE